MKLKLFNDKLKSLTMFLLLSIAIVSTAQSQKTVTGTVFSAEDNQPLPGASVLEKGTSNGTTTDFDGKFNLQVKSNSKTLVVSYIGYKAQEVAITDAPLVIKLQNDANVLEEVVVVGYGTQKKSVTTGAISAIKAKDIEKIPSGRIEQALQGRVAGVVIASNSGQPGSSSTVRVRGITTFDTYGGNTPLYVVDGVIVDAGGIGYINKSDIESVEVLKDAASLAIYGARAASGVILVTTKKGSQGKFSVNYNTYTGYSAPDKVLNLLNATEYGVLMNEKSVAAGGSVIFPNLSILGVGTDWQKSIFNYSAKRESHEVSLSGGNDVSSFYVSFGLNDDQGIVSKEISNFNKKSIRLNSTHKLSKLFTFGQTLGYTHQVSVGLGNTNSEFGGPLSSAINLDPITPIVVTDPVVANSSLYTSNSVFRDKLGNPYGISSFVGQEMSNPVAYVNTRLGNSSWGDDIVGNAFLEVNPIQNLKIRSSVGAKLAYWGGDNFTPKFFLSPTVFASQNSLSRNTNKTFAWNFENTASYTRKFNNHNVTLLLGQGTYVDNISSGSFVTHTNLPVNTYKEASFTFPLPALQKTGSAYTAQEHRVISLFSRLNYDYKEKYLFTGIIRRDGSTNFGPNNKFGYFPSFSAGWVISKEGFWKENNIVNSLKLRVGYGVTGNDAIPPNGFLALIGGGRNYTFGSDGVIITPGSSPNAPANPDLKWEETTQTNIGFDTKLFNDFNLTVEYYDKKTNGILQFVDLPGFIGATGSPLGNVADMDNKGFEIELGYRKSFGEFNFSANGNLSYLKNEVTFLGQGKTFITTGAAGFQSMGSITRTQVGQSYNTFYGYKTAGIFQSQTEINAYTNGSGGLIQPNARPGDFRWTDTNNDGTITDADKQFLGSPLPKYTFGITFNLEYKGIDFTAFAQGATGNKIFQGLRRLDILNGNYQTKALGRWTGPGTSNSFPRLTNNDTNGNFGKPSDFYLEKGDYLRLKIIQLGYTLPNDIVSKIGAQKVRFYISGENLITITKYTGYDPEIGGDVLGIDRGYYPQAQTFMLGANIQF